MSRRIVYVSRLTRLPLISSDGSDVGHVVDVVIGLGGRPPRVNGLRRRRAAPARVHRHRPRRRDRHRRRPAAARARSTCASSSCARASGWLVGELIGRRVREQRVVDVGITPAPEPFAWEVATVALGGRRVPGLRRAPEVIDWSEAGELFAYERPVDREAATLGGLHPGGDGRGDPPAAAQPPAGARRGARGRAARRPARGALRGRAGAARRGARPERLARVLDEMEADDAADLLAEFSAQPPGRAARRDGSRGGRAGPPAAHLQAGHRRAV